LNKCSSQSAGASVRTQSPKRSATNSIFCASLANLLTQSRTRSSRSFRPR
jgi:hypothetical protein